LFSSYRNRMIKHEPELHRRRMAPAMARRAHRHRERMLVEREKKALTR
jgi:hypothetical protein